MKIWQADLAIMLSASFWGLSYIFTRWGLVDCSPALFLCFRFGLASIGAAVICRRHFKGMSRKTVKNGLSLGLMMGAGYVLQTYSVNFTEITRAAFLTGMALPAIPLLSFLLFGEKLKKHNLVGIVLALAGLYILMDPSFSGINSGDVLGLISIPVWALYMIYMSVYTVGQKDPKVTYQLLFLQLLGAVPFALVSALIFESGLIPPIHPDLGKGLSLSSDFFLGLFCCAFLASLATVFIQTRCQKYTSAVQAMLCYQLEPVTASLAAFLILAEPMTANILLGGAIIICGVLLSEFGGIWAMKKAEKGLSK
jgi:drug/metabolite transporter (DMT)-like permease